MKGRLWLRLGGALLLAAACTGAGIAAWAARRRDWQTVHTFAALLDRLRAAIRYQGAPCAQLLEQAAADERFAALGLAGCRSFADIPLPPCLGAALQSEARQVLREIGGVPSPRACALLAALGTQAAQRAEALRRKADDAWRLYPKLGFCAGVAAALLLA